MTVEVRPATVEDADGIAHVHVASWREIGDAPAYLWSAEDNPRAQAFYLRNGFGDDGTRRDVRLAGHPIRAARFVR
jgi:hypothetical protein